MRSRLRPIQDSASALPSISAVDLFCGAGGLTHGLICEGVNVRVGVDIDPAYRFPFENNNKGATFIEQDVRMLDQGKLSAWFTPGSYRALVGCAPCQPFSRYNRGQTCQSSDKWQLLRVFAQLVCSVRPDMVSMENVPDLLNHDVLSEYISLLKSVGFYVSEPELAFCPAYGIPQQRTRLILLASRLGPIQMMPPTHSPLEYPSVRQAIGMLPRLSAGESCMADRFHYAPQLSKLNFRRIQASMPGGTWRDWPIELRSRCHRKQTGATYPSVYGRMEWDSPSPTITTQFYGYGTGRFGHPEQDRALSLREGALLQSFPRTYQFVEDDKPVNFRSVGRMIGNAVPVNLGRAIAKTMYSHLQKHVAQKLSQGVARP